MFRRRFGLMLLVGLVLSTTHARAGGTASGLTAAQRAELTRHFGFGPLEVFKIEKGISQLRPVDVNGDGRNDLVLANNAKSTIEVLLQRAEPPDDPEQPKEVNDLVNPWRFERKPVSVTWRVDCLKVADVTGDGNVDLIFYGEPQELVVLPGNGDGDFRDALTWRVRDGLSLSACLDVGDLDGDGRDDVALLGKSDVIVFTQKSGGGLNLPRRFAHALDNPVALKLSDLDGDQRQDLIVVVPDGEYPLYVRYQDAYGHLGPFERVKLPGLRSLHIAPRADRRAEDLFGVERVSGRLKAWRYNRDTQANDNTPWAVRYYPLPAGDGDAAPLAWGDVNGDRRLDLVVAEVGAARMLFMEQRADAGLLPARPFAGQTKMRDLRAADTDGDGRDEIYALSPEEGFIARSKFAEDRLQFPQALPTIGKPYVLDLAPLAVGGDALRLAYVSRDEDDDYHLILQPLDTDTPEVAEYQLDDQDDPPSALRFADVNRDGRNDVLIFTPYAPLRTLIQDAEGKFVEPGGDSGSQQGLLKDAKAPGFCYADVDGDGKPEVLLAQRTFVRALVMNAEGAWEIKDQFNAPGTDAEITGVTVLPRPGAKRPDLIMYDKRAQEVHVFVPATGGTYELSRSVDVGGFDLRAIAVAPLAGTDDPTLMLMDKRRVALVLPDIPARRAHEIAAYESSIKDGRLSRLASGDLNHDGRTDLAVIELKDHVVEVLTFGPNDELVRGNKFRVFAKKRFRGGREAAEPRWVSIADVTDDGIDDLMLIAHDRVLLYPGQ
jgi:hypothetical protein